MEPRSCFALTPLAKKGILVQHRERRFVISQGPELEDERQLDGLFRTEHFSETWSQAGGVPSSNLWHFSKNPVFHTVSPSRPVDRK
mmetsp:Transcript_40949/g.76647  ORF Transcript_40949/g.76647 Transcript_40949/m.76647 type:complete len:86 (-) Transcript_40949:1384-1641(-)